LKTKEEGEPPGPVVNQGRSPAMEDGHGTRQAVETVTAVKAVPALAADVCSCLRGTGDDQQSTERR